jgi:flagellar motor switch protein FliG
MRASITQGSCWKQGLVLLTPNDIFSRLSSSMRIRPFDFIRRADTAQIYNFLQNEHPQTIALILSYLDAKQAAPVLSMLPFEKQINVITRIANMGATSHEYVKIRSACLSKSFPP